MCSRLKHMGKVLVLEQIKTPFKIYVIKKGKKNIIISNNQQKSLVHFDPQWDFVIWDHCCFVSSSFL